MPTMVLLLMAATLLAGLIQAEKKADTTRILLAKAPLSFLFIIAWTLETPQNPVFAGMILAALAGCLGGDLLLALGTGPAFLAGLICFLTAHLIYAAAFFTVGCIGPLLAVGMIGLAAAAAVIWRWLEPHLGHMRSPVLAYIVGISIMVCGALMVLGNPHIPAAARVAVAAGAVLFYLSDLFVARQRFVVDAHVNRMAGLPLYYLAQFLLAFAAAWVPR